MKKLILLSLLAPPLLLAAWGCNKKKGDDQSPRPRNITIRTDGSTTLFQVTKRGADRFMELHPNVTLTVTQSSSGTGIKKLIAGEIEIGRAARDPKPREFARAREKGIVLKPFQIAHDALAIVVHPSRYALVKGLTREQVRRIFFEGTLTKWAELSPTASGSIVVYVRDQKSSGAAETFTEHVTGKGDTPYVRGARPLKITTEMVPSVARDPNGIAFTPFVFVDETVRAVSYGKSSASLVPATIPNIRRGTYLLRRNLFLLTRGTPQGALNEFIQFMLSIEGQRIVRLENLIPIR